MSGNSDNFYEEVEARGIRATPRVRAGAPPGAVLAGRTSARLPLAELFFGVYRVFRANVRTWLGQKIRETKVEEKGGAGCLQPFPRSLSDRELCSPSILRAGGECCSASPRRRRSGVRRV
jgi:hypothetical protein